MRECPCFQTDGWMSLRTRASDESRGIIGHDSLCPFGFLSSAAVFSNVSGFQAHRGPASAASSSTGHHRTGDVSKRKRDAENLSLVRLSRFFVWPWCQACLTRADRWEWSGQLASLGVIRPCEALRRAPVAPRPSAHRRSMRAAPARRARLARGFPRPAAGTPG